MYAKSCENMCFGGNPKLGSTNLIFAPFFYLQHDMVMYNYLFFLTLRVRGINR